MGSCASSSSTVAVPVSAFDNVSKASLKRFKPPLQGQQGEVENDSHWRKLRNALPDIEHLRHSGVQDTVFPGKQTENFHLEDEISQKSANHYKKRPSVRSADNEVDGSLYPKEGTDLTAKRDFPIQNADETHDSFSGRSNSFLLTEVVESQYYPELEQIKEGFDKTVSFMKNCIDDRYFDVVCQEISDKILEPYKMCWNKEHRRDLAYHMAKIGFAKAFVNCYKRVLHAEQIQHYTGAEENFSNDRLLCLLRDTAWRLISGSKKLAYKFGQVGFISMMLEDLRVITPRMKDQQTRKAILSALAILYHCGKADSNKLYFREGRATAVLLYYVQSSHPEIKTAAILTLAHIMDEGEVLKLMNDPMVIRYIIKVIEKALLVKSHRADGYSCLELVEGLTALALNDEMKRTLVQNGVLPSLTSLLEIGDAMEKEAATKALWTLAFHRENRQKLLEEPKLMPLLETLEKSSDAEEKMAAQRALFVIKEEQIVKGGQERMAKKAIKRKRSVERLRNRLRRRKSFRKALSTRLEDVGSNLADEGGRETPEEDIPQQHVMISYNWSNQKTILKVRDYLRKNGYNVWMDVDSMGGSTLQAMAEAVEDAAVVLICMSEKYKQSPNCRTEAEYAYQLRKDIVPLLLQRSYKPDGWLGIILGAKLFFDFSGKYKFATKMDELCRELGDKGKEMLVKVEEVVEVSESKPSVRSASQWEPREVRDWLRQHNIRLKTSPSLTGEQLIFLQKLNNKAPEFFYSYLQQELGVKELADIMNFVTALENLDQICKQ